MTLSDPSNLRSRNSNDHLVIVPKMLRRRRSYLSRFLSHIQTTTLYIFFGVPGRSIKKFIAYPLRLNRILQFFSSSPVSFTLCRYFFVSQNLRDSDSVSGK